LRFRNGGITANARVNDSQGITLQGQDFRALELIEELEEMSKSDKLNKIFN
jgi:hypothetical protein